MAENENTREGTLGSQEKKKEMGYPGLGNSLKGVRGPQSYCHASEQTLSRLTFGYH